LYKSYAKSVIYKSVSDTAVIQMSMVIRKAKIIEHDKLILNSYNKVRTTWGVINKESGRNKKKWSTSSKSWR